MKVEISHEDYAILTAIGIRLRKRLQDVYQDGCPDLSEDGQKWEFSFAPKGLMSPDVKEVQALIRFAGLEELRPVKFGPECETCVHGRVHLETLMIWPLGDDCDRCSKPSRPYHLPLTDLKKYNAIKREEVYEIPVGSTISWSVLKAARGGYNYYEASGFVWIISDEIKDGVDCWDAEIVNELVIKCKRICKIRHLGRLREYANQRA